MQIFVVQQLATFEKPTVVRQMLNDQFGVDVTVQNIVKYDISHPEIPQKWRTLFEETRKRFLEDTSSIPIANKAYRLKQLDRLFSRNQGGKMENPVEQRATLEQAAKEVGDAYTNRRELTGPKGGPIQSEITLSGIAEEVVRRLVKENGWTEEAAREFANRKYGSPATADKPDAAA